MKLWDPNEPIIQHMDEDDVYKLTMGNFIYQFFPNVRVAWELTIRSQSIRMSDYINMVELWEHLDHAANLNYSDEDIVHFRSWGIFPESFLKRLRLVKLSKLHACPETANNGAIKIEADGFWLESSLWETRVLRIIQTLYTRGYAKKHGFDESALINEGDRRLTEKLKILRANPQIKYAAFWMRRAASVLWDKHVTERAVNETPDNLIGISNVHLARKFGKEAVGTRAHELDMVVVGLRRLENDELARLVPYEIMHKWRMTYGHRLLIMLGDTFGTDAFLRRLSPELARVYRGFRLDSGDPFEGCAKYLRYYDAHRIDARDKLALPSDSLNVPLMIELERHFRGQVQMSFGLGTDFSNDLGIPPLPAVMKPCEAAGHPVVKLSDNISKATGPKKEIEEVKRIFGYNSASQV